MRDPGAGWFPIILVICAILVGCYYTIFYLVRRLPCMAEVRRAEAMWDAIDRVYG